jgi:hypothetical protein
MKNFIIIIRLIIFLKYSNRKLINREIIVFIKFKMELFKIKDINHLRLMIKMLIQIFHKNKINSKKEIIIPLLNSCKLRKIVRII